MDKERLLVYGVSSSDNVSSAVGYTVILSGVVEQLETSSNNLLQQIFCKTIGKNI